MSTKVLMTKPSGGAWQKIDGKWQATGETPRPNLRIVKTERNLDIQANDKSGS